MLLSNGNDCKYQRDLNFFPYMSSDSSLTVLNSHNSHVISMRQRKCTCAWPLQ